MPITTPERSQADYKGDTDHFKHVLDHLFTPALSGPNYRVIPPVASGSDLIHAEIIRNLPEADLVLCDMSTLNANVFFELGIRTALDRPVATVRDNLVAQIPFDHLVINCHSYNSRLDPWILEGEINSLQAHIRACAAGRTVGNTLWRYFGVEAAVQAQLGSTTPTTDDKFDYLVHQMESVRQELSRRQHSAADERVLDPDVPALFDDAEQERVRRSFLVAEDAPEDVVSFLRAVWNAGARMYALFSAYMSDNGSLVLDYGTLYVNEEIADVIELGIDARDFKIQIVGSPDVQTEFRRLGLEFLEAVPADARFVAGEADWQKEPSL